MTTVLFYLAIYCAVVSTFMMILSLCFIPLFINIDKRVEGRLRCRIHWIWFDFWMGMYYDKKKQVIWFAPFPMLMVRIWWEDRIREKVVEDVAR